MAQFVVFASSKLEPFWCGLVFVPGHCHDWAVSASITIIACPAEDPDSFEEMRLDERRNRSAGWATFPLRSGRYVDTLLMKATNTDFGIFESAEKEIDENGDTVESNMIARVTIIEVLPLLEALVEANADETARALWTHGGGTADLARVCEALRSDAWPESGDPADEAAAFAHQLLKHARYAVDYLDGVCWEYRGDVRLWSAPRARCPRSSPSGHERRYGYFVPLVGTSVTWFARLYATRGPLPCGELYPELDLFLAVHHLHIAAHGIDQNGATHGRAHADRVVDLAEAVQGPRSYFLPFVGTSTTLLPRWTANATSGPFAQSRDELGTPALGDAPDQFLGARQIRPRSIDLVLVDGARALIVRTGILLLGPTDRVCTICMDHRCERVAISRGNGAVLQIPLEPQDGRAPGSELVPLVCDQLRQRQRLLGKVNAIARQQDHFVRLPHLEQRTSKRRHRDIVAPRAFADSIWW